MTTQPVASVEGQNVGSPDWWRDRLYKRIVDFRPQVEFYSNYYTGDHPLPWLAPQARDEFRRILSMTRSNYMGLVCDAMVERIHVEGFRFGNSDTSDEASWDIWQFNNMDSDSDIAWLEAAIASRSYFMVEPNEANPAMPRMSLEIASQAVTESMPGNRRLLKSGMKVFTDDWTGLLMATLYLMNDDFTAMEVFKYETDAPREGSTTVPQWRRRTIKGEDWGGSSQMLRIPLHPILNNPRATGGRSELYDLTDVQDRINKTIADRMMVQDYGAFPQKWMSGWPSEDDEGNPNTIDIGRNRAITTEVVETKFGSFAIEPLDPYSNAKHEDVKDIASRSRTPAQYLLGEMNNVNGETLKASESGLIAKVKQRMRSYAEAAEEAMRTARVLAGTAGDPESEAKMEVIFANPEFRTEGEMTDATIKKLQAGIASLRQARRDVGYSETTIRQLEREDTDQLVAPIIQQQLRQPLPGQAPPNGGVNGSTAPQPS